MKKYALIPFWHRWLVPAGFVSVLILASLLSTPIAFGSVMDVLEFDSEAKEQQYRKLVRELRCTVCQSETIYESNAALAADMRRRVYEMTEAGASEEEIINFLVQRYGDYVRYRPAIQSNTVVLWASPFILLMIGVLVWIQLVSQRRRAPVRRELTVKERAAIERLHQEDAVGEIAMRRRK